MTSCNENLLELPVQYIYILHVITIRFTNKEASIELLFEMNTNTLFDNLILLELCLFTNKKLVKIFINL